MQVVIYKYHFLVKGIRALQKLPNSWSGVENVKNKPGAACHSRKQEGYQRLICLFQKKSSQIEEAPIEKDGAGAQTRSITTMK